MMATYPKFCNICSKGPFAGAFQAQQHMESSAHKAKEILYCSAQQENLNNPYFCQLCNISTNSQRNLAEHLSSPRHNAAAQRADEMCALGESSCISTQRSSEKTQNNVNLGANIQERSQLVTPIGNCNACGEAFTDDASAEKHFASDQHKKVVQRSFLGLSTTSSTYSERNASEIFLYSRDNIKSPDNVSSHGNKFSITQEMKNLDRDIELEVPKLGVKEERDVDSNTETEYTFNGQRGYCNVCNIELTSVSHKEQHLQGQKHRKAALQFNNIQKQGLAFNQTEEARYRQENSPLEMKTTEDVPEYVWYGTRGRCNVCNLDLTSEQHAQQHLSGKNHQKKKSRFQMGEAVALPGSPPVKNNSLYCDVCEKPFTGPESAAQHYASAKHKQRVEVAAMCRAGQQMSPGLGFICDVCHCTLNTLQQLEIHRESPRHKAEEAKKLRRQASTNQDQLFTPVQPKPKPFDEPGGFILNQKNRGPLPDVVQVDNPMRVNVNPPAVNVNQHAVNPSPLATNISSDRVTLNPFTIGLEQLSLNLSQGFLFNKITFGELCPEESISQNDANKSSEFVSENSVREATVHEDTVPKSMISEHDESTKIRGMSLNTNLTTKDFQEKESLHLGLKSKSVLPEIKCEEPHSTGFNIPDTNVHMTDSTIPAESNLLTCTPKQRGSDLAHALKNRPKRSNSKQTEGDNNLSVDGISDDDNEYNSFSQKYDEEAASVVRRNLHLVSTTIGQGHCLSQMDTPATQMPLNIDHQQSGGSNVLCQSPFPHHKFYCSTCNKPMNTRKAYEDHMNGRGHMQKVATEVAPPMNHTPIQMLIPSIHLNLTKTKPRGYQRELLSRAMEGDKVIFLPTGTGKTLIASMTVSAMLMQNPTRQVVFLVDRVLLVIQQAMYLKNELSQNIYKRFDPDRVNGELIDRKLQIAVLCGGQQSTGGVPLWKHDLIIVTAAFYMNLLQRSILRWDSLSLVVFDEAHHCVKNHPFNQLLKTYHLRMDSKKRPKILGLTASPAGRQTVEDTSIMLKQFMANMGDTKLAIVQNNKDELRRYQSNAQVTIMTAQSSQKETMFRQELQQYLLQCYMRFCQETDMLERCKLPLRADTKQNLSDQDKLRCAEELEGDLLNSLQVTLDDAKPRKNDMASHLLVANLSTHIKYLCYALNSLFEAGIPAAFEEIQILMASRESCGFEFARDIGLQCDRLLNEVRHCQEIEYSPTDRCLSSDQSMSSKIDTLVCCLIRGDIIDWRQKQTQPMALVLVKQRSTAALICHLLQSHSAIKSHGLSVVYIVGHGTSSGAQGGMSVNQQKRILHEVKNHNHQIIIATSVAEEGVDIPECQVVVSMNPPSTVTALVQMRGRARRSNSKFVIICTDLEEKSKLEDLQMKENNMIIASESMIQYQRERSRDS